MCIVEFGVEVYKVWGVVVDGEFVCCVGWLGFVGLDWGWIWYCLVGCGGGSFCGGVGRFCSVNLYYWGGGGGGKRGSDGCWLWV